MSKKNKAKFRKRIKAQLLNEMAKSQPKTFVSKPSESPGQSRTIKDKTVSKIGPSSPSEGYSNQNSLSLVRQDLKKSALIIGGLIILIVALTIADSRTNFLLKIGNRAFNVLHLQI